MKRPRGFTLLEVLVVLIITSMLAAVLMQAFGLILTVRTNLLNKIAGLDAAVLERNLYLTPIRGVVPDYPDRPDIFVGSDQHLHALTVTPLLNRPGTPVGFDMYFDYSVNSGETSLMYQEKGRQAIALGHWPGNTGSFSYRDNSGQWLAIWPAQTSGPASSVTSSSGSLGTNEKPPQTPFDIRIQTGHGFPSAVIASLDGAHNRVIRMRDTPMGGDIRPP